MSQPSVMISQQEAVCHIQLNRPEVKNAIDQATYIALAEAISSADADPSVRVILLSGAGGNFCSGNDLGDFAKGIDMSSDNPIGEFLKVLPRCSKPVIAGIDGVAVGIGVTMLTHCDLVYAAPDTRLSVPFNKLGVCAEFASSYLFPRLMGRARAMEVILLGEEFSAEQARQDGIVTAVVADPVQHAMVQAHKLSQYPPQSTRLNKQLLNRHSNEVIESVIWDEIDQFARCLQGDEFREAVTAFMQKRKADFSRFN